jgi:hypothetical protein
LETRTVSAIVEGDGRIKQALVDQFHLYNATHNGDGISESLSTAEGTTARRIESGLIEKISDADVAIMDEFTEDEVGSQIVDICLAAARSLESWEQFVDSLAKLLGTKDLLLLDWYNRFGGRIFIPVTGGGHTSDEVISWMNAVFMPQTTCLKDQSSRVKNAYG